MQRRPPILKKHDLKYTFLVHNISILYISEQLNSPIAKGPPMLRNFSLGAHTAMADNPPTIPPVIIAALIKIGPPMRHIGANTTPKTEECTSQATCLAPNPGLYSIPLLCDQKVKCVSTVIVNQQRIFLSRF